jgi:hypothetical protein
MDIENKIITESGEKYSRGSFEDYHRRAQVIIETNDGEEHQLDIYTTNTERSEVEAFLKSRASNKVVSLMISYWTTRQSDDANSKFIDIWLNEGLNIMEKDKKKIDFGVQKRGYSSNIITLEVHKTGGKIKQVPIIAPLTSKSMGDKLTQFILEKLNEHKDEISKILEDEIEKH